MGSSSNWNRKLAPQAGNWCSSHHGLTKKYGIVVELA